jgi:hypothetical protein
MISTATDTTSSVDSTRLYSAVKDLNQLMGSKTATLPGRTGSVAEAPWEGY